MPSTPAPPAPLARREPGRAAGEPRRRLPADRSPEEPSTRDRILDVATDLFIEQGYDKTSLREIAAQLGFSKAALYYHFASKADILMALHLRLHDVGARAVALLGSQPIDQASLGPLLDQLIDEVLTHHKLFELHERNRVAFEQLHKEEHQDAHDDLEEQLRRVLADPAVPMRARFRIACAFGAIIGSVVMAGDAFADVSPEVLGQMLRQAVRLLLEPEADGELG